MRVWRNKDGLLDDKTRITRTCQGRCSSGQCLLSQDGVDQCFQSAEHPGYDGYGDRGY